MYASGSREDDLTEHGQVETVEGPPREEPHSPVHAREITLEDVLAEIQEQSPPGIIQRCYTFKFQQLWYLNLKAYYGANECPL